MKKIVLSVLSILLVLVASCSKKPVREVLVVYTALEDDYYPTYLASFKKQHPEIDVQIVRNSTGIITSKLIAERDKPAADVIWGVAATSLMFMNKYNMLQPYKPKGFKRINKLFADHSPEPLWVGIDIYMSAIVVNEIELKKGNFPEPTSYQDLLNPIYKGKIVLPNPRSSGTGYLIISGILQSMGEEKGWRFLDSLHLNVARYVHSGTKPAKLVGTGEYLIGISPGFTGIQLGKRGQPVKTIFPKEGSGWDIEGNALIKKDSIKPAAKIFLDWAISEETLRSIAKNCAIVSSDMNTTVVEGFPEKPLDQLSPNDFSWSAQNRTRILAEWARRYENK